MRTLNTVLRPCSFALTLLVTVSSTTFVMPTSAMPHVVLTPEQNFQMGLEAQAAREFRGMLSSLRLAAGQGHMEAQEMLGLALLVGPTLYGPAVKANRCEAALWLRKAVAQGSQVGKAQLDFLNRLRSSPSGEDVCQAWGG